MASLRSYTAIRKEYCPMHYFVGPVSLSGSDSEWRIGTKFYRVFQKCAYFGGSESVYHFFDAGALWTIAAPRVCFIPGLLLVYF